MLDDNYIVSSCSIISELFVSRSCLIRALTQLAQKSREMASHTFRPDAKSGDLPNTTNINFYQDITYVCFNSMQPVFTGCKRVVILLWQESQKQCKVIMSTYISINVLGQERQETMVKLLNIPKLKFQGLIRRLTNSV
ncbi:MAG: hypothetical protein EZS28_008323 [Streblomastix strix]|uniref:Uncharacterized protein n=1 Tax=Streblomastix strix TaxID=222440 RepID=A0A5J4WNF6_9EUKA|nr:MAG: hypothetical protein EZS28_008323 [Streblomastix strix]